MTDTNASTTTKMIRNIKFINLGDMGDRDRLGSQLNWYICTILVAIKNKYEIRFRKPKKDYDYFHSIFVESLFSFVEDYNATTFGNTLDDETELIEEDCNYFRKMTKGVINIKNDFVTAFKESVYTQKFKDNFLRLAKTRNYVIPFDTEKTIVVHLRLDDVKHRFINDETRKKFSTIYKTIIDNDDINYTYPGWAGQSALSEDKIKEIIEKALTIYKDHEVIIITNGLHTLPYKTINSNDESYDLFLLANANVLIGSMSTFSFMGVMFGNHKSVYYPLWEHVVCFGLTTKYDKNTNIEVF
jgi:hypothetical protein